MYYNTSPLYFLVLKPHKVETPCHDNDLIMISNITTKWLKVNMKLSGISHGQF